MKISITKTLQKGVEAHRRGQFLDADKLYTDILEVEPKHPDANHNKGLLAARVGNHKMAVKFFKVALNADLTVPQFWLSLHDSLINLNKIDEAKTLFLKAKRKNIDGNILNRMLQQFNTAKIKGIK